MSLYFEAVNESQYLDHYFEAKINIRLDHAELSGTDIPLNISVRYEGGGIPEPSLNIITVDPRTPAVIRAGAITVGVRVMFNLLSMQCENKRFVLYATASPLSSAQHSAASTPSGGVGGSGNSNYISPAFSTPIRCVRHMLDVSSDLPLVWFKDEGGRDRCMDVTVRLLNGAGHLVTDRRVPLRLVLRYRNGNDVLQQDLLKVSPDCRRFIDESGSTTIKFRIEDVSKNHQKQPFGIWIGPDTNAAPQTADVGAVVTKFVDIKSKRNKRKAEDDVPFGNGLLPGGKRPNMFLDVDSVDSQLMGAGGVGAPDTVPLPAGSGSGRIGPRIANVVRWVCDVSSCLEQISWKRVGYEMNPNGSPDHSRPLYAISNPNDLIQQLQMRYRSLGVLETLTAFYRADEGDNSNDASPQQQEGSGGETSGMLDMLAQSDSLGPSAMQSMDRFITDDLLQLLPQDTASLSRQHSLAGGRSLLGGSGGGSMALPALRRAPSLQRQHSLEPIFNLGRYEMYNTYESQKQVSSILALNYVSIRTKKPLGLPAFDGMSKLVGFFVYDSNSPTAQFHSASEYMDLGEMTEEDEDSVRALISQGGGHRPKLCSLPPTGDAAKDLDDLVELALKTMWMTTSDLV